MKMVLSVGLLTLATVLSLPAQGAPGDDLAAHLDRVCPAAPAPVADTSLAGQGKAVDAYAAGVAAYQECLYTELRSRRAGLTQSEQAVIAGRLSRSTYDLSAARQRYAGAVRAARAEMQVAERSN
ncbi:hypothetical protein [Niveispirillum sp.]|uniref:hypothetical protein n=1 Tax=Niveispirillum sp. TaxID=1917217 RepID=UPI001B467B5C|nr:hypothetical protein [Niveispirillum sp.]MBP7339192.1 hypothetical protein [Niveispirillum sp.]